MSALWTDLHQKLNNPSKEILYADDTLLYSTNPKKLDDTLKQVETESTRYGLALNYGKCEFIGLNYTGLAIPRFKNNNKIKRTKQAKYLGVLLTEKAQPHIEIQERIKQSAITWKRLNLLWKVDKCSTKTKLQYWNAVVKTKLTYALETMYFTKTQLRKLDTFQLKGLRKILKMHTTFIDRSNTNKAVRKRAADFLYHDKRKGKGKGKGKGKNPAQQAQKIPKRIPKISTQVKQSQHTLLLHTLREPPDAPTRQATFRNDKARPNLYNKKRVGRPRKHWTIQTMRRAWNTLRPTLTDPTLQHKKFRKRSRTIQNWLHAAAVLRIIPTTL